MTRFRLENVQPLHGFAASNALPGQSVWVLTKSRLTSDDADFYKFSDQFAAIYLAPKGISVDSVIYLLVLHHLDDSAEVYLNESLPIHLQLRIKRDVQAGQPVKFSDIGDIRALRFEGIELLPTDKVVFCLRVGWRFGLFFDVGPRERHPDWGDDIVVDTLDIETMQLEAGDLYRKLVFYHLYKTVEQKEIFERLLGAGWFPFVELLSSGYGERAKPTQVTSTLRDGWLR